MIRRQKNPDDTIKSVKFMIRRGFAHALARALRLSVPPIFLSPFHFSSLPLIVFSSKTLRFLAIQPTGRPRRRLSFPISHSLFPFFSSDLTTSMRPTEIPSGRFRSHGTSWTSVNAISKKDRKNKKIEKKKKKERNTTRSRNDFLLRRIHRVVSQSVTIFWAVAFSPWRLLREFIRIG